MFNLKSTAIGFLALAGAAKASCSYSTQGHGFEMYIYSQTGCAGTWEEFYGAGIDPACQCFNIATALNDKVKSFVFTASGAHSINIYQDANCNGALLGTSVGNWIDSSVSTNGQQMSSFNVCLY